MMAIFMYRFQDGDIPKVFQHMFTKNYTIHSYPTRQAGDYHVPNWQLETRKRAASVQGAMIWNGIPASIKASCSLNVFKCGFKKYLIDNA